MPDMGRRKTAHPDLPPRMVARVLASGKRLFYYGRQKIPLGPDLNQARVKWAELENSGAKDGLRFPKVADAYETEVLPGLRTATQREYKRGLRNLSVAFAEFTLDDITPQSVKEYMVRRTKKIASIREKQVLSAMFKWAREQGYTDKDNPCRGVGFSQQEKANWKYTGRRDRYVTEKEYADMWAKAPPVIQDVMDLLLLTSQRLGDVLRWTRNNLRDGVLIVKQAKTGKDLRIRVEGELETVLNRILARPRAIQTVQLIADKKGQRYKIGQIGRRFRNTRALIGADWRLQDLRAKAITDEPDIRVAQRRAGHSNELTTARVYRRVKGDDVGPLR